MLIDTARQLQDLLGTVEAFRAVMIQSGATSVVRQDLYFKEMRALEAALQPANYIISEAEATERADAMRDTIARAAWRYQMGPGTFDQPLGQMGELVKKICIDEAENIRRALMGEPQLPGEPQTDDDVVF